MSENYFMGLDGFVWFTGVVEDRNDPDKLGRVRVRCLGFHTEDLNDIPTNDLPWAHVMHPVTSPSMQGLGDSPSFLVEGSWVIGFFRDAVEKQQPIIMGSLPGKPTKRADPTKGFNDPRGAGSVQDYYGGTPTYGPYPLSRKLKESDTNRLARGEVAEKHIQLRKRRKNRQIGVQTATQPFIPTVSDVSVEEDRGSFDEPNPRDIDYENLEEEGGIYRSGLYPYNHVFESESGHITEVDDTPGAERTFRQHKTGTYEEIIADGTKTVKVIGDNYEIIVGNSNVYVAGSVNLTIKGDVRHLVQGNYHLEVEGDYTQKIGKNMRTRIGYKGAGGNLEEIISGTHSYNIEQEVKGRIGKDVVITTEGNETKNNNGFYSLTAKSDITAITTGGSMLMNASTNFSIGTSGIMTVNSGASMNVKSATAMTLASETTFTGTASGIGTFTFSGSGSDFFANNGSSVIGLTTHTHTDPAHAAHGSETSTAND